MGAGETGQKFILPAASGTIDDSARRWEERAPGNGALARLRIVRYSSNPQIPPRARAPACSPVEAMTPERGSYHPA